MAKLLHYCGIAALGFLATAAIGITLGASTMLACYLTTCGISHTQRAAVKELREIDEDIQLPVPAPAPNENQNDRKTWANNGSIREQTNVVIRPIEQYPAQ